MDSTTSTQYFTLRQHGGNFTIADQLIGQQNVFIVGPYLVNGDMIYTVYATYNPITSGDRLDFYLPLYNTEDVPAQLFSFKVTENQATLANEGQDQYITIGVNNWKDSSTIRGNCAICHFSADQISNEVVIRYK